jgi:flagellar L-ring protein precursor FlgH
MSPQSRRIIAALGLGVALLAAATPSHAFKKSKDSKQLRAEYVTHLQQQYVPSSETRTVGSLWSDQATMGDISSDYKAFRVNDTVTILVSVQTSAAQTGSVDSERSFSTNSAVTGVLGKSPASTNPLLSANSSSALKGQGSTASNTTFTTSLTGQVIAVLPNGNLIVEAERKIFMNNQHEDVIVRGMVRPGDIGAGNTVPSAALSNLEIEMKGKGIISDGVRPPNPLVRAVLWLFNF